MKRLVTEEKIEQIINEELGVANEAINLAKIIENKIIDFIKNKVYKRVFKVKTKLSELNVDFVCKNFNKKPTDNDWIEHERNYDGYSYSTNTIYVNVGFVNGKLDVYDLIDGLNHECAHYWDMQKSEIDFHNEEYDKVIRGINNKNMYVSLFNSVRYYSFEPEIRAFANGTFATAMRKKKKYRNWEEFVEDNQINDAYSTINKAIEKFSNPNMNDALLKSAALLYGCDAEDFVPFALNMAVQCHEKLIKEIGRIYTLYLKRLEEEENQEFENRLKNIFNKKENGDV